MCHSPLDITTALDASGSVQRENWEKCLDFAGKLAEKLLSLNTESRVGVIVFSQVADEAIPPTSDRSVLNQGLNTLKEKYQNGITRTELALSKALEIFQRINRAGAKKRLIVITDGKTTPLNNKQGLELLQEPTEALKAAGVHIIAVGVGSMVDSKELNFMAADPDDENVLHLENYDQLLNMVNSISQAVCEVKNAKDITLCFVTRDYERRVNLQSLLLACKYSGLIFWDMLFPSSIDTVWKKTSTFLVLAFGFFSCSAVGA